METKRQQKIAKLLLKDLSEILQMEMRAVTSGALITVTKIVVSPDLYIARVYLSIFGVKNKEAKLKAVQQHKSEIRGLLGNRVRHQLRSIPELEFFIDDSLDYIQKIDNLLKGD